jgi:hypothetical protein
MTGGLCSEASRRYNPQDCIPNSTCVGPLGERYCGDIGDGCGGRQDCGATCPDGSVCGKNSDCSTGQVCFWDTSASTCVSAAEMCTYREPNFNRCMCPGCTCNGTNDAAGHWAYVV